MVSLSSWTSASTERHESDFLAEKTLVTKQCDGHYFINGSVNNTDVKFIVDTGATVVGLSLAMAANAGMKCEGVTLVHTANGIVEACTATIEKLRLGHITLRSVQAIAVPNLSQPLLGMNVLEQFRVEQDNGQMRLSRK